jgi:hypothetical protein
MGEMPLGTSTIKENLMRAVRALFCAVAVMALVAPGVRGDEYTKQTFLTFSGPVQLPNITLPAGTYQFKLADPDSGRRTLQVWDKEGTKLYTTLLTIPDERMEASDDPVVMFAERPAGVAQAVKAWFYPGERTGQEFVYPRKQAMTIAKENHSSVLAFSDDTADSSDAAKMHAAKVGRVDENGQANASAGNPASAATNTAKTPDQSSTSESAAASRPSAAASNGAPSSTAQSGTTAPSANRTATAPAAVGTTGTTTEAPASASAPVRGAPAQSSDAAAAGTRGQSDRASNAGRTNAPANQSGGAANQGTSSGRQLPRTASQWSLVQILSGLILAGGISVRQARKHLARNR